MAFGQVVHANVLAGPPVQALSFALVGVLMAFDPSEGNLDGQVLDSDLAVS
jgi:hypothetical protein